jgi:hypothetical protein
VCPTVLFALVAFIIEVLCPLNLPISARRLRYHVGGLFRKDFPVTSIVSTSELSSLQENFSSVLENRKIRNRSEIVIVNSLAVFATDRAF